MKWKPKQNLDLFCPPSIVFYAPITINVLLYNTLLSKKQHVRRGVEKNICAHHKSGGKTE